MGLPCLVRAFVGNLIKKKKKKKKTKESGKTQAEQKQA
jgi:hypothetical protein